MFGVDCAAADEIETAAHRMAREIRIKFPGETRTGTAGRGISSGEGRFVDAN